MQAGLTVELETVALEGAAGGCRTRGELLERVPRLGDIGFELDRVEEKQPVPP